jgi:hypothetical protein
MAGTKGTLTCAGRTAADLGVWNARLGGDGGRVQATVTTADAYWLEHGRAFVLELYVGKEIWRWRDVLVASTSSANVEVQALGKPERVQPKARFFEADRSQKSPWVKQRKAPASLAREGSRYG